MAGTGMDVEIDAAQHLDLTEGFRDAAQAEDARDAHRQLRIAPINPWRDSNATIMKSRPSTACQRSVQEDRNSLSRMIAKAPMIGPDIVPAPPTITINRTCPDAVMDKRSGLTNDA